MPLDRSDRRYVCARGHSFDVARSGYINLLQPQDRRSLTAGDSSAAVEARARLLEAGIGRALITDLVRCLASLSLPKNGSAADLGSGTGDALSACVAALGIAGAGIDLSTAAVRHASRRFPDLTWAVANADRRLPLLNDGLALLLSLHGRRNPAECARVLSPIGFLLVAVPAADDLIELRGVIQGQRVERSRVDALVAEHDHFFKPVERFSSRAQHRLDEKMLTDLLQITYRGARAGEQKRVASLTAMDVTLASDCLLFRKRRT